MSLTRVTTFLSEDVVRFRKKIMHTNSAAAPPAPIILPRGAMRISLGTFLTRRRFIFSHCFVFVFDENFMWDGRYENQRP